MKKITRFNDKAKGHINALRFSVCARENTRPLYALRVRASCGLVIPPLQHMFTHVSVRMHVQALGGLARAGPNASHRCQRYRAANPK